MPADPDRRVKAASLVQIVESPSQIPLFPTKVATEHSCLSVLGLVREDLRDLSDCDAAVPMAALVRGSSLPYRGGAKVFLCAARTYLANRGLRAPLSKKRT
jgi:hypothetical protein